MTEYPGFRAVFSDTAVATFAALSRRRQRQLLDRSRELAKDPFLLPDYSTTDTDGRESGLRGGCFGLTVPGMLKEEIAKLSASEKLLLVNDLWDELADVQEEIPLTDEQKALLDERYRAFLENPDEGEPWEVVRERIAKSL